MEKILTISVAAYNSEKWLERCLDSFLIPEIIDDIEVIIVNDGSKDNTSHIAEKYTNKYPNSFVLINKENGGHGSTINASIPAARGKYYKVVDSDDWVESKGLTELVYRLKNTDADADVSPYYITNADGSKKELVNCIKDTQSETSGKIVSAKEIAPFCSLAMHALTFKTSLLQNNFIKIDEKCFYVDSEYIVFYLKNVQTLYISDIPVYDYLVGTNEQSVNLNNMIKRRDQHLKVFKRILEYYNCSSESNIIVNDIIKMCAVNEYKILFGIEEKAISKNEFTEFDSFLRSQSSNIYYDVVEYGFKIGRKITYLVWLLRKLNFHGFNFMHKIMRSAFLK